MNNQNPSNDDSVSKSTDKVDPKLDRSSDSISTKLSKAERRRRARLAQQNKAEKENGKNNDNQNTSTSNLFSYGRSFQSQNYSTARVSTMHLNNNVLASNYRTLRNSSVNLKISILPDKERLQLQANCWARRIVQLQELPLKHILGVFRDRWISKLEKCYIYSYYRAVLYALTDDRVREFPIESYCPKGHAVLYEFLNKGSFSFRSNDIIVNYIFEISKEDYNTILTQAKEFDFIDDRLVSGNRFSLINEDFDGCMKRIHQENVSGSPDFANIDESEKVSVYLTRENFSIMNSFYKVENNKTIWYYSYHPNVTILCPELLFGKACFITSGSSTNIEDYFNKVTQDDENDLVKYEVAAICGSEYPDPIVTK